MDHVGSCGRFQVVQVVPILLARFVSIWGIFLMLFGIYNPGWRCIRDKANSTTTIIGRENQTRYYIKTSTSSQNIVPLRWIGSTTNESLSSGRGDNADPDGGLQYNGTCDVIDFCQRIEFNPESSTIITEYGLVCNREWISSFILIVVNAGFIVGSITSGQVSERLGRKVGLYGNILILSVSSGAAIFSPDWQTYTVFTFFIGVSGFGNLSTSVVFAMEFLNSKWRGLLGSKPIACLSLCGLSFVIMLLKNWKHLHILICLISTLTLLGYFIVVESPRWLFVYSQDEKAVNILEKIAKQNSVSLARVTEHFTNNSTKLEKDEHRYYSYLDLFREKRHVINTLQFSTLMIMVVLIYHSLTFGVKSIPGDFYTNAIIASAIQAPIVLIAGPVSNLTGRRGAGFVYAFLGAVACLVIVVSLYTVEGHTQATIIKASAYIAKAFSQAALSVTLLCAVETFPTAIRSVGVSFVNGIACVGGLVAPYVIPRNNDVTSFAACFSVMALCFLVIVVIFYSISETKNKNLKDNLKEKYNTEQLLESTAV